VKLLHVIAHKADLSQLCGDVSLAFVNVFTNKLVYSIAGPKFGEHEGRTVIIRKALHGLCTSAKRWHSHFADTLRSLGFKQTRFDNHLWFRLNLNGNVYDNLCTGKTSKNGKRKVTTPALSLKELLEGRNNQEAYMVFFDHFFALCN
jgi:hypothetical protein